VRNIPVPEWFPAPVTVPCRFWHEHQRRYPRPVRLLAETPHGCSVELDEIAWRQLYDDADEWSGYQERADESFGIVSSARATLQRLREYAREQRRTL